MNHPRIARCISRLLTALACASGCREDDRTDCASRYRLQPSTAFAALVRDAVQSANSLLPNENRLAVAPVPAGEKAAPVWVVRGDAVSPRELMFVPRGEQCVLINADGLSEFTSMFAGEGAAGFSIDDKEALTLLLLHEAGHVSDTRTGLLRCDSNTPPLTEGELKAPRQETKHPELRADKYAAELVARATRPGTEATAFLTAVDLQLLATKISWNLSTVRFLRHFGQTSAGDPSLAANANPSHPNLEMRFLVFSYALSPTAATESNLMALFALYRPEP